MNKKNETKQNNQENGKKQKKSFLSNLIEIENKKKSKQSQKEKPKPQKPKEPQKEKKVKDTSQKQDENGLTEEEKLLLNTGEGVNLVPKKSKAEIVKEKKKFSFSVGSMVSLLVLIVLSLGVVSFNIFSKRQLNKAKETLYQRETELEQYTDKILANEEILDRTDLYRRLQEGVFSPKEILQYIMGVVNRAGNIDIRTFDLGDNLSFETSGSTTELSVVARLWYLLGIDDNIDTINLNSVGKSNKGVNFTFEGQLNTDKFIGK
jgi:hypothetical protein